MAGGSSRKGLATAPAARLTWDNVLAWRLRRQHLDRRAPREALVATVAAISAGSRHRCCPPPS